MYQTPSDMTPIQWVSVFTILVIIIGELYYSRLVPIKKLLTWVMIFWMTHGLIYYSCIILDVALCGYNPYLTWSSILRLHGYLTIAGVTYYRISLTKLPKKEKLEKSL
jgi:hypothetical protein